MNSIFLKPDMRLAAREGGKRKTQTRRVIKELQEPDRWHFGAFIEKGWFVYGSHAENAEPTMFIKPRYQVGEVVYIREAFATEKAWDDKPMSFLENASEVPIWYRILAPLLLDSIPRGKWRSPLFMPAWAARDFIKITDVRPERLQEITELDCKAERISAEPYDDWKVQGILSFWQGRYAQLWDSINPLYPWASNPWVWVYSFVKADRPKNEL